jgi:RNA polymerase sigma-70 factor (ECF subfamily)
VLRRATLLLTTRCSGRFCRGFGRSWADGAEDVVQDTLLAIHRARHTYDPDRPFEPWLAAIARHRLLDAWRRRQRDQADPVADVPEGETFSISEANKEAGSKEAAYGDPAALRRAIAMLPTRQRQAIELVKLKEMTLVEASRASGMSVAALKVAIHRGMKALRAELSK